MADLPPSPLLTFIRSSLARRHNFPDSERLTAKQWSDQLISISQGAEKSAWAPRVIIGGCCGTALEEIAELRKGVDALD